MSGEERDWLSNFSDNVLENFAAYKVEANAGGRARLEEQMAGLEEQARDLEKAVKKEKDPAEAARLSKRLGMVREHGERVKVWLGGSGAAGYARLTEAQKRLHDAAFVTNAGDPAYRTLAGLSFDDAGKTQTMMVPKGDVLYQFREDVKAGTLPAVSWLVASEKFSDHPASPWYGAWYVSEALDILASHPEVWKKTIFILTYDENDGYFDHAPSFVAADPRRPETGGASAGIDTGLEYGYVEDELELGVGEGEARSGPIGMGFRVPMIVASPWTRGGWVNSQVFDHTSTLMFMEEFVANRFGKTVREENISSWRRCVSGDLVSCFRGPGEVAPELMYLDRDKAVVGIQRARYKALPANFRKLTAAQIEAMNRSPLHAEGAMHQEPGIRPACAVPYELYAEGEVSGDGRQFVLRLKAGTEAHGARAAGAGFNVYLRNLKEGGGMRAATYAVKAGDGLAVEFPLVLFGSGGYAVEVHGPNGFYRSFAGVAEETGVEVRLSCEREGSTWTGDVGVHVRRGSGGPVGYEIRDNSYRGDAVRRVVAGGGDDTVVVPLKRSYGWYDFTVQVEGWKGHARFAGHVDTGRASFSDPLMGGVI
jgi:phospholipase C